MPLTYQIKEEGYFLEVHGKGTIYYDDFQKLSEDVDGKLQMGFRVYLDLRSVDQLDLNPSDVRKLVALQKGMPEKERPAKSATVTRSGHDYALSRMFQLLAMDNRLVTTDVDEAWTWLNASDPEPASALD